MSIENFIFLEINEVNRILFGEEGWICWFGVDDFISGWQAFMVDVVVKS
ncbi:hypothetical protein [Mucilaginibacter sp.]|nr:hypothetical protein [Mucilaginibacter sp.]MDR3696240.1 hypothetical protein [Mucilaginibacter sp.]